MLARRACSRSSEVESPSTWSLDSSLSRRVALSSRRCVAGCLDRDLLKIVIAAAVGAGDAVGVDADGALSS